LGASCLLFREPLGINRRKNCWLSIVCRCSYQRPHLQPRISSSYLPQLHFPQACPGRRMRILACGPPGFEDFPFPAILFQTQPPWPAPAAVADKVVLVAAEEGRFFVGSGSGCTFTSQRLRDLTRPSRPNLIPNQTIYGQNLERDNGQEHVNVDMAMHRSWLYRGEWGGEIPRANRPFLLRDKHKEHGPLERSLVYECAIHPAGRHCRMRLSWRRCNAVAIDLALPIPR